MNRTPRYIHCRICGQRSPRPMMFKNRMKWLREHRKKKHPRAFRASIRKGLRTRRRKNREHTTMTKK